MMNQKSNDKIVYLYYPDGHERYGEIEYIFSLQQAHVARKADNDESGYFAHKATRKVEECVGKNNLPLRYTQAWY